MIFAEGTDTLKDQILKYFSEITVDVALKLLACVLILVVGFALIRWLIRIFRKTKLYAKMDDSVCSFATSFMSITLKILLLVSVALIIGVPAASIVTLIGSAGLAIGLALQGSLSNLAGGFIILVFKPFRVGDYIEVSSDISGTVVDISVFYTSLMTVDNRKIMVPNSDVTNKSVKNYTTAAQRRVDLQFGVDYASDIDRVKAVILEQAQAHPKALQEPAPFARLKTMADSSLIFELRVWVKTADYWEVYFDLNEGVKKAFDANGISIPFPQMDVHLDK